MHLALLADGNGRWGLSHYGVRTKGHEEGARTVRKLVQNLPSEVKYLTIYGLSLDNVRERPKSEVAKLYQIFEEELEEGLVQAQTEDVRVKYLGDGRLPAALMTRVQAACNATERNEGLTLSIAISYSGRDELIRAISRLQLRRETVTKANLAGALDTRGMPDVDMLVRTGGEKRLSDFLLWQVAYAELFFTDTLFPDFSSQELATMIAEFHLRDRKFGRVSEVRLIEV